MIFAQSKVLKLPKGLNPNNQKYVAVQATNENLEKLGIHKFSEGLTIVPSIKNGITCKKNLCGYSEINKSLPKEYRIVRTVYWSWQLYNGDWDSDYKDVYMNCYQKTFHAPQEIEMKLITIKDKQMILTKVEDVNLLIFIINIYLEVFNYCETLDDKLDDKYNLVPSIRCNWVILPPDVVIQVKRSREMDKLNSKSRYKNYNQERINELEKYKPICREQGLNGFQGYYAYLYEKICILESPIYGNATYVVKKDNWEELSKMTKKSLINSGQLLFRFEHKSAWLKDIAKLFS